MQTDTMRLINLEKHLSIISKLLVAILVIIVIAFYRQGLLF